MHLGDQQLAGLIMWVPTSAVYLAAAFWSFLTLLDQIGRHAPSRVADERRI